MTRGTTSGTLATSRRGYSRRVRLPIVAVVTSPVFSLLLTAYCLLASPGSLTAQTVVRYQFDSPTEPTLFSVSTAAFVASWLLPPKPDSLSVEELGRLSAGDIPAFDRPATLFSSPAVRTASDIAMLTAMVAPLFIMTEFSSDYATLLPLYLETVMITTTLTNIAKMSGRIRPLSYNTDAPLSDRMKPDMRRSFFSGHTSVSMAAGVFIARVYERYHPGTSGAKQMWAAGVGMGLLAGGLRVFSGMHYPSDVLVGALVGAAVGYAIPALHEYEESFVFIAPGNAPPPIIRLTIPL